MSAAPLNLRTSAFTLATLLLGYSAMRSSIGHSRSLRHNHARRSRTTIPAPLSPFSSAASAQPAR
jgi:hypothetical protein